MPVAGGVSHSTTSRPAAQTENRPASGKYSRAQFGDGWADTDGDCQDSRAEALIATSTVPARLSGCRVVSGRWISPYTGNVIHNAKEIDIDHVVPQKYGWDHGAANWSRDQREKFANDPINLWPVEAKLNREKGAKPPSQWLPPRGQCQYVARFKRVALMYRLNLPQRELSFIEDFLKKC